MNQFFTTFRGQLMVMFSALLTAVMAFSTFLVFGEMKNMVIVKHMEAAKKEVQIGTIPLLDGMLLREIGKPIPPDYFDKALKHLRTDPAIKTLYAYLLDEEDGSISAYNADPQWTGIPIKGNKIFKSKLGWILQVTNVVSISTKSWGTLILGIDADPIQDEVRRALFLVMTVGFIVIAVTLIAINSIAKRLTFRLNTISEAVDSFDLNTTPEKLLEGQDEVGRLAAHINDLRERLLLSKSELRRSERQVFQAEKLAAIGRLAAGMAHEINNPLTGIRHAIANILSDPGNEQDRESYLKLMDEALKKIEMVIGKLLGYSRKKGDNMTRASLNNSIRTALQLLDFSIQSNNIRTHLNLSENLSALFCDPHLLDEIAMNLIINAIDAVDDNGTITCKTWSNDEAVFFEIEDNGHGISGEQEPYIFDPFFTTKDVGKGTGLGLYVTQEIIHGLNGEIQFETHVNSGTKFTVNIPITS